MKRKYLFAALAITLAATAAIGSLALAKNYWKKTAISQAPPSAGAILKKPAMKSLDSREEIPVINHVATGKRIIALTFDADMTYGMERELKSGKVKSWYNDEVIKILEETETPATLFLTGLWLKNYPEKTKELAANHLFEIGNHSYSHPGFSAPCYKLPAISNDKDEQEIIQAEYLLERYAPNYKKYFRFPGLCYDDFDIVIVQKHGYKIIHGDVIAEDGFTRNANGIVSRVVSLAKPGSIIVLHMHGGPDAPKTGDALPEIIRQLKEKGYTFVKVSELLASNR